MKNSLLARVVPTAAFPNINRRNRKLTRRVRVLIGFLCFVASGLVQTGLAQITLTATYCTNSSNPCVTTYHNDNNRDGVNPNESTFKASTLVTFSGLTETDVNVDGLVYAQPLYIHQLSGITGVTGSKNVIFVATENNSVYSIDASNGNILVHAALDFNPPSYAIVEHAVPYADLPGGCNNIAPEVGITGTPVIDTTVTPPIMWLVSKHEDRNSSTQAKTYVQKLHGLYTTTLGEIPGSPMTITYNGFDANAQNQRAGLALFDSSPRDGQRGRGLGFALRFRQLLWFRHGV
jgi:hypothetical protein